MKLMFTSFCLLLVMGIALGQPTFQTRFSVQQVTFPRYSLVPAGDGGSFMIGSQTQPCGATCNSVVFVHHFSTVGKLVWTRTYGTDFSLSRPVTIATKDGGFAFLGRLEDGTAKPWRGGLLVKCDGDGNVTWKKQLVSKKYTAFDPVMIREDNDGNMLVFYTVRNDQYYSGTLQIVKLTSKGKMVWNQTVYLTGTFYSDIYEGQSFKQIGDRYYILGAGNAQIFEGERAGNILVLNTSGKVLMSREIHRVGEEYGDDVTAYQLFVKKGQAYLLGLYSEGYNSYRYLIPVSDTATAATGIGFGTNPFSLQYQLRDFSNIYPLRIDNYTYFSRQQALTQMLPVTGRNAFTISQYDSLKRICPDYVQPVVDTTTVQKSFTLDATGFGIVADSVYLADIGVVVSADSATYSVVCRGQAPADEKLTTSVATVKNSEVQLYPNPVQSVVWVSGVKAGSEVLLYNTLGSVVKRIVVSSATMEIDVKGLHSGIYFLKVLEKGKGVYSGKMMKE